MSLACSDVRVLDRTENPNAPRTAHVNAGLTRATGPLASLGRKATMDYQQQKSLCFLTSRQGGSVAVSNFIAKATNGEDSGSSSTSVPG